MENEKQDLKIKLPPALEPNMKEKLQCLQQICHDFEQSFGGVGTSMTDESSDGQILNHIFQNLFPSELKSAEIPENELNREINLIIRCIEGGIGNLRNEKSFEIIAKKQIRLLKEPSLHCLQLCIAQLSTVIRQCAQALNGYESMKEETEKILLSTLQEREILCKTNIILFIDAELAYINSNHEDFIGFESVQRSLLKLLY